MVIVLTVTTMLAGFLLGYFYQSTAEAREKAAKGKLVGAISQVVSGFDNDPSVEKTEIMVDNQQVVIYPAMQGGELIGCAVESSSNNGFSGKITIVTGFDRDCNILGYNVISHAETPGLGAKMNDWFRNDSNRSVVGRNPIRKVLKVTKDNGEIDGITAATISSRAFLEAINTAAEGAMTYYQQSTK